MSDLFFIAKAFILSAVDRRYLNVIIAEELSGQGVPNGLKLLTVFAPGHPIHHKRYPFLHCFTEIVFGYSERSVVFVIQIQIESHFFEGLFVFLLCYESFEVFVGTTA